jgi:large subunit ribosomal protein L35
MANKCKIGRIKSHSGAKKRLKVTGKHKYAGNKPAHNHLLGQKSKRQKRLYRQTTVVSSVFGKQVKRMLPGK